MSSGGKRSRDEVLLSGPQLCVTLDFCWVHATRKVLIYHHGWYATILFLVAFIVFGLTRYTFIVSGYVAYINHDDFLNI